MAIEFYKEHGPLGFLATYSNYGFYVDGVYYPTVEHYYQSEKFDDNDIKMKIISCDTPKEASNIGRDRNLKRRDGFNNIKLDVMYKGTLEKFLQNSTIRSKLIETRNNEIKEMTEKENYWGVGPLLDGENHYGKILMSVRDKVKEEVINNIINKCTGNKVYVIGHHNPDFDSVCSSYILSEVLKSLGIDAVFSVRDENLLDKDMISDYLPSNYLVVNDYSDKLFILVDHNNLDGILKGNVLGSFDHHIITNEVDNLIEMEYASCGLLIYDLFKDKYKFTNKDKLLVGLSVLSDTEYFTSSRFSDEDKDIYNELGLDLDAKKLQKKYFKTTDFTKKIIDNIKDNYKEYDYNGIHIKRSMIYSYMKDKDKFYSSYILEAEKNNIDLLIWCDYESKTTYVFYKGNEFRFPYFTNSTNLVIKYLEKEKYL